MTNLTLNSNSYINYSSTGTGTVVTGGYGGGGGYTTSSSSILTLTIPSMSTSSIIDAHSDDIVITKTNGKRIHVGECIENIMEVLCMIVPDHEMMKQYPVLKDAYQNHINLIREKINDADIKESYESYQLIKNLVTEKDIHE